jgi:hypothetical protein
LVRGLCIYSFEVRFRLRSGWLTYLLLAIVLWTGFGCAPEESSSEELESEPTTNFGEVVLAYVQPTASRERDQERSSDALSLSARFVHIRDIARHEERFLWEEDLPLVDVAVNECQEPEARSRRDLVLSGSLELLDAGDLSLQAANQEQRVPDWNFPSVYGVVAGVVYGGDEPLELGFHPQIEYRLSSTGSEQIGAFEVAIRSPAELTGVVVGGVEVGDEPITIESPAALEVRWEPDEETNEVLVELSYAHFSNEQRWVCRSREDGQIEIPAHITSRLWEAGVSDPHLVIYRLRRQPFRAESLEEAEALFVVSLTIPLELP